jgi:hypothetical protein
MWYFAVCDISDNRWINRSVKLNIQLFDSFYFLTSRTIFGVNQAVDWLQQPDSLPVGVCVIKNVACLRSLLVFKYRYLHDFCTLNRRRPIHWLMLTHCGRLVQIDFLKAPFSLIRTSRPVNNIYIFVQNLPDAAEHSEVPTFTCEQMF